MPRTLMMPKYHNRFAKFEWLMDNSLFATDPKALLDQIVQWMPENDFEEFYDQLCANYGIERSPDDPNRDKEEE